MKEDFIFRTPRLLIRKLRPSDLLPFHQMQSNQRVMRYTGTSVMSREENSEDLKKVIKCYDDPRNILWVWAVAKISDLSFVGTCALVKEEEHQFEIGVRLLEDEWGRGYGKEITMNLLCYAFQEWQAESCVGYIMSENISSIKMSENYLEFLREYFNEKDQVLDRVYRIDLQGLLEKGIYSRVPDFSHL